jgi:putative transposase
MKRRTPLVVNEFYHLYSRGVDKRKIFWDDRDCRRFLALLYLCNGSEIVNIQKLRKEELRYEDIFLLDRGEPLVAIGAYCLMPNHFHILIHEISEGGTSLFMKKLLTGFAMYINKRHERSGTLFEGRFKSEHVHSNNYFHYLYSYIHLNPLKVLDPNWRKVGLTLVKGAMEYLKQYPYSSYKDYLGDERLEAKILSRTGFPDFFQDPGSFERFHEYWLSYSSHKD